MPEIARKLSAILAADVAGYSKSMTADEMRTLSELRLLRNEVLAPLVTEYRGTIIKSMGDGWLVEFASAIDAVNCAIQIQKQVVDHELIQLRIGIHIGDVVHEEQDIFGDGVNIAARLQVVSQPGGIIISDIVHRSIDQILGREFANLGARSLKNIPAAVLVFGWRGSSTDHHMDIKIQRSPEWTDTEVLIVALARTGDEAAFTELVKRHQSWVRNLMRRTCGDAVLADDLAQDTFLRAWRTISGLRHPTKFAGWLRRLSINIWLAHVRKNDTLRDVDAYDDADWPQAPTSGAVVDLDRALGLLPNPVRLCIVLAYHEGMTHAEIAEHTNIPLGTVKSHIRRGTDRLQNILSVYRTPPYREKPDE